MPKLHVVTNDGTLIETIGLDDYDLTKPLAGLALLGDLRRLSKRAREDEAVEAGFPKR